MIRVYLSNIAPGWPIQRQKETLATCRVPSWPDIPTYIDNLPPMKRKAHAAASLVQRGELLRETSRSENVETILVASLACLAWEQTDFLQCVSAVITRGANLVALDTGRRISPNASPNEIIDAAQEFIAQRRAAKGGTTGTIGYIVSAEKRATEAEVAAKNIKNRWELPTKDYPTDDLLAEAGICRNTANLYLGKRPDAQRKHRNALANAERNKRHIKMESQEQTA